MRLLGEGLPPLAPQLPTNFVGLLLEFNWLQKNCGRIDFKKLLAFGIQFQPCCKDTALSCSTAAPVGAST